MTPTDRFSEKGSNPEPPPCHCHDPDGGQTLSKESEVGVDDTDGRFGEVDLYRCRSCGRAWLNYLVEYEAFSRSGRWARGLIDEERAETITPETAIDYLHGLDWYIFGGSYFGGKRGKRAGPMFWGEGYGPTPAEVLEER